MTYLRPNHSRALGDSPQRLTQVPRTAHKRRLESVLLDVVRRVRGREHLALVDIVDTNLLQDLALDKVSDARLGHDGNCDGLHDLLDHRWVGHACYAAVGADVGWDALEGHDGHGAGFFCYSRLRVLVGYVRGGGQERMYLLGVDDVHDHTALEHACQTGLDGEVGLS